MEIEYMYFKKLPKKNKYVCAIQYNNGNKITITNKRYIKVLLNIVKRYGYELKKRFFVDDNVDEIYNLFKNIVEYENSNRKIKIYTENIPNKTTINRKKSKKHAGRKIICTTLVATTLFMSPFNINADNIKQEEIDTKAEITYTIENEVINHEELEKMINDITKFKYEYENRTNSSSFEKAKRYDEYFEKYGNMYGIDKSILRAIAAQESSGDHYNHIGTGPAEGLMQIEKSVWVGNTISAHNYNTNETDTIKIGLDDLHDIGTNIQISAMIFQNCLKNQDYNITKAIQTYNYGPGNMNQVLEEYTNSTGKDYNKIIKDQTDNEWLQYRNIISVGDNKYLEHVLSYVDKDNLEVKAKDKTYNINIENTYTKEKTKNV